MPDSEFERLMELHQLEIDRDRRAWAYQSGHPVNNLRFGRADYGEVFPKVLIDAEADN